MICKKCGLTLPDLALDCPLCLRRKAQEELFARQKRILPEALEGRTSFPISCQPGGPWHLMLVGDPGRAWCGKQVPHLKTRRHVNLKLDFPVKACDRCRALFDEMVKELATSGG